MKRFVLFVLFAPVAAFGQHVGVSALAGYSYTNAMREQGYVGGLTTRLTLTYPFSPHTVLGAFYEVAAWTPKKNVFAKPALRNNKTYGITYDVVGTEFFLGMKLGLVKFDDVVVDTNGDFTYPSRVSFGLQGGLKQRVATGLWIVESVGVDWMTVKGTYTYLSPRHGRTIHEEVKKTLTTIGLRVGVAYEFGHEPKKKRSKKRIPMESDSKQRILESQAGPRKPTKDEKKQAKEEKRLRNPNRYIFGGG